MEETTTDIQTIDIAQVLNGRRKKPLPKFVTDLAAKLIHQKEINRNMNKYGHLKGVDFMEALVQEFDLKLQIVHKEHLPQDGRALFVCNHPLGGLDGICLSYLIGKHYNGSVRYIVNDLLYHLKPLQSIFVPVNKYGTQARSSVEKLAEAMASPYPLLTFPAGLCSRYLEGRIQDIPWNKSFIRQAVESRRDIVPLFFVGRNSLHFYIIEWLRRKLGIKFNVGTVLLPDEMFRAQHKSFSVVVGKPIPYTQFEHLKPAAVREAAVAVRNTVYALSSQNKHTIPS